MCTFKIIEYLFFFFILSKVKSLNSTPSKKSKKFKPDHPLVTNEFNSSNSTDNVTIKADVKFEELQLSQEEHELFESLIKRELDPNGGATIIIADQNDIDTKLILPNRDRDELIEKFSVYFLTCAYSESKIEYESEETNANDFNSPRASSLKENDIYMPSVATRLLFNGIGGFKRRESAANYAIGIVRNSACKLPDIIDYFAENYPQMIVKTSLLLNSKEINTLRISEYRKNVNSTYLNGTFRYGPLLQTSLVGVRNEEIGDYFPDFIENHLEKNNFLNHVMPWGDFSINEKMNPMNSDDGPIIWARPGEQMIPTSNSKDQQLLNSNNNSSNMSNGGGSEKKKK
jgi:hypothetical protein